jgi:ribosomal protein L30, bacterial/organelle
MARYIVKSKTPVCGNKLQKGEKPYENTGKKVIVTLKKSTIACLKDQQATVAALGLRKIGQSKEFDLNPAIEGMLFKVRHLVEVEEVK